MECEAIGDCGITCHWSSSPRPALGPLAERLRAVRPPGVTDVLAAFDRIAVLYDPVTLHQLDPIHFLTDWVRGVADAPLESVNTPEARTIALPVHYGGRDGPDVNELARTLKITTADLIDQHAATVYTVAAVGFLPGFAYLDGLPAELHAPRRGTPRARVPAGSVAIGGPYTGVYPVESPGGWHVIGRTSATLYDPADPAAAAFCVGDRVRFVPQRSRGRKR